MLSKKCQRNLAKKIGNICALIAFIYAIDLWAEPRLELSITNSKGHPVKEVGVGVPFSVHVRMLDTDGSMPQVRGLSNFVQLHARTSSRFNVINGQSTSERTASYSVRAPQTGTFTLGPAELLYNGSVITSNTIHVIVGEEEKAANAQQQQNDQKPALFQLKADKKEIYAGEPLYLTVRFLYQPNVQLVSPPTGQLHTQGWVVRSQSQPTTGVETIDNNQYQYTEQILEMYNYQPGPHTIPRFSVSCVVPTARRSLHDDFFDISDFFGRNREQHDIHSNILNVAVKPLPSAANNVAGVAHITRAALSLAASSAQEGEGCVARLELDGEGDAASLLAPTLQLPSTIHYYESKNEVQPHNKQWKKIFEYIMQGTQPGVYEIPAQSFVFFDYKTGKYTTHHTQSVKLTIVPSDQQHATDQESSGNEIPHEKKGTIDNLKPIYQDSYWSAQHYRSIDPTVFIIIIILLLIVLVACIVWRFSTGYRAHYVADLTKKNAFKHARGRIASYKKLQNVSQLYSVIVTLFAQRLGVQLQEVTHTMMEEALRKAGLQEEKIKAWLRDHDIYAELVYFSRTLSPEDSQQLFSLLEQWITIFEEIL